MTSHTPSSVLFLPSASKTDYLSLCLSCPQVVSELTPSSFPPDPYTCVPVESMSSRRNASEPNSKLQRQNGPQESVRLLINSNAERSQNALSLSMIAIQLLENGLQHRGQSLDPASVTGFICFLHREAPRHVAKLYVGKTNQIIAIWTDHQHDCLELLFHDAHTVSYSIGKELHGKSHKPATSGTTRVDQLHGVISMLGANNLFNLDHDE